MRILVVGHNSMLGRRFAAAAAGDNTILTAGRNGHADLFLDLAKPLAEEALQGLGELDVIVHCAASFDDHDWQAAFDNELTNAAGAYRVAEVAACTGCKHVVYVSTIFSIEHPENGYFGSYGLSKRHGDENLVLASRSVGFGLTTLLVSSIYDERGEARKHQPLLYLILDRARAGSPIVFYGSQDRLRDYVFVDDVVEVVLRAAVERPGGRHPVLSPGPHTLTEIAELAKEVFASDSKVEFEPDRDDIASIYLPSRTDLESAIGYAPVTELRTGIRRIAGAWRR